MITKLFIPDRIGSYYLFSQRIIGLDIGRTEICAAVCTAQGNKRTIEQLLHERFDTDGSVSHEERMTKALKSLFGRIGSYDAVYVSLASSLLVFKELSVPFIGSKKIKMVMPFEVEAMLPFSLENACIDGIITHEDMEKKETDILVAAIKQDTMAEFLNPFKVAGIQIDKVTVDMFELYGLYQSIPEYAQIKGAVLLVDSGFYSLRTALIIDGQLKYIRTLSKSMLSMAKKMGQTLSIDPNEALNQFMRFGVSAGDGNQPTAIKGLMQEFVDELTFTFDAFNHKLKMPTTLSRVVLTGAGADIQGITSFVSEHMGVQADLLPVKQMVRNGIVQSKITTLSNSFLISIATALSSPITQDFNIQQFEAEEGENKLINKQIIGSFIMIGLIVFSLMTYGFVRLLLVKNSYATYERETIKKLDSFKLEKRYLGNLVTANNAAMSKSKNEEETWKKLSATNRYSLLLYLSELSKNIHRDEVGLDIERLTISLEAHQIVLYGRVKNYETLRKFEEQLASPLFESVPKQQEPVFEEKPINILIKSQED